MDKKTHKTRDDSELRSSGIKPLTNEEIEQIEKEDRERAKRALSMPSNYKSYSVQEPPRRSSGQLTRILTLSVFSLATIFGAAVFRALEDSQRASLQNTTVDFANFGMKNEVLEGLNNFCIANSYNPKNIPPFTTIPFKGGNMFYTGVAGKEDSMEFSVSTFYQRIERYSNYYATIKNEVKTRKMYIDPSLIQFIPNSQINPTAP